MTDIVAANTCRPDIACSPIEAVDGKPLLRRSPEVAQIVDEQPFARAFSRSEDRDRVSIQLRQLYFAPHRNDRSLDSFTRRHPHLASALTEPTRKPFDLILKLAPGGDMSIDINRLPVRTVQSRAGCFENAASPPLLLFLRALAPREVRKQLARAALISTICQTPSVDPSAQRKAVNDVWRCCCRMGRWQPEVKSQGSSGSHQLSQEDEETSPVGHKSFHITAGRIRYGIAHDNCPLANPQRLNRQ